MNKCYFLYFEHNVSRSVVFFYSPLCATNTGTRWDRSHSSGIRTGQEWDRNENPLLCHPLIHSLTVSLISF